MDLSEAVSKNPDISQNEKDELKIRSKKAITPLLKRITPELLQHLENGIAAGNAQKAKEKELIKKNPVEDSNMFEQTTPEIDWWEAESLEFDLSSSQKQNVEYFKKTFSSHIPNEILVQPK